MCPGLPFEFCAGGDLNDSDLRGGLGIEFVSHLWVGHADQDVSGAVPFDLLHVLHADGALGLGVVGVGDHVHFWELEHCHDVRLAEVTGDVFRIEGEFEAIHRHTLLGIERSQFGPLEDVPHNEVLFVRSVDRSIEGESVEFVGGKFDIEHSQVRVEVDWLELGSAIKPEPVAEIADQVGSIDRELSLLDFVQNNVS